MIDGATLDLAALETVARDGRPVALSEGARGAVRASRRVVDAAVERKDVVYGVTTGFGNFADVHIETSRLRELQVNLVRSHAAGVGAPLGAAETRALMLLRANVLAKGFSGVRLETLEALVALLNHGVHPVVPSQGSVGASGDLAPLAHLALALIGEGECVVEGRRTSSADALRSKGLAPVVLEPKEGLALVNGTQLITALLGLALARALRLARAADAIGALTLDALEGTDPQEHAMALSFLHHNALAPEEWRCSAHKHLHHSMNLMPKSAIDNKAALKALPPLIKGYLRLGAFVGDGAVIDRQFGTTDVMIILPVEKIDPRYFGHFGAPDERKSRIALNA